QHGLAADGRSRLVVALVQATRDVRLGVVGLLGQQLVDLGAGHRYQNGVGGGGGFLDRAVGMTDEVGHGVDVVVAQGAGLLGRLQLGSQSEGGTCPALDGEDFFQGVTLAGTRVADVDALALEVIEAFDVGITTGEDGEHFALQREHGTDVAHRAFGFERRGAVEGLELVVGLHDAEIEFAAANAVHVGYATAAGRGVALDAVLGGAAVEETADGLTGNVIDACLAAGADGDEFFFSLCHTSQGSARKRGGQDPCQGFAFHGISPFSVVLSGARLVSDVRVGSLTACGEYARLVDQSVVTACVKRGLSPIPDIGQNRRMSNASHESAQASVSASLTQAVLHAATRLDLDRQALLSACGLRDEQLADPDARIPFAAQEALWHELDARLQHPEPGLLLGRNLTPGPFSVLSYLLQSSATLKDALNAALRYQRLGGEGGELQVE